jgi:hypothetical protein
MTDKRILSVLDGSKDKNTLFADLQIVLSKLGFSCRIKGDHFVYTKDGMDEIINIQPQNGKAKPYQVRQVRDIINKHHLQGDE